MLVGEFDLTANDGNSDLTITSAGTSICDQIEDLDGMTAVSASVKFNYGSGGTTCKLYLQTLFGSVWVDIACFAFTTSSAHKIVNLSGLTPKTTAITPTDGSLTDDTCVDGILGTALRAKVISTGTYAGSTQLVGRVVVR